MSGYNRSCSRADSSILLAAQCAAALSMIPASAPSCWAHGVTAASYREYAIGIAPLWETERQTIGGARSSRHSTREVLMVLLGARVSRPAHALPDRERPA